ncbi:pyridoxamine 5'-phosphate oxidase family protein [Methanolobus sp. ZRKC3]|uniref:pyridoxamine 5'-phosphate oxidase family protein n=1 Tax=Methanolobus sp. ZRKC3 TaxID=3125786 RepID=UPI00324682C4
MTKSYLKERLKALMEEQKLGVLATFHEDEPYTNLVAFATSDDLKYIFFVTPVSTRKYSYLSVAKKASMMIDNRSNDESDFKDAMAVNATGNVMEIEKSDDIKTLYLEKHPFLMDFIQSPSSALMRMDVERYIVASKFQNVVEVDMT